MGQKPLTWQQVCAVLCVLAMLVASIFAWGGNIPDAYRARGAEAFWTLLAIFILLLWWHWCKVTRRDLQPDVLAQIFAPRSLMQLGPMHIFLVANVRGARVRLFAAIQNTRDGEGHVRIKFKPQRHRALGLATSGNVFLQPPPPLDCLLPPSGVVVACLELRLHPLKKPMQIRLWLDGSASASGATVRFGRRTAITHRTSGWVTALALLGGHLHAGGGTYLAVEIAPFAEEAESKNDAADSRWCAATMWTPEHNVPLPEVTEQLRVILQDGLGAMAASTATTPNSV